MKDIETTIHLNELREKILLKRYLVIISFIIITIFIAGCTQKEKSSNEHQLTISAAISLSDVLIELKSLYEQEVSVTQITYNFGGSGTLAQQIQQGAPVDLFISANEQWIDTLLIDHLIDENTLTTLATNELVLIGHSDLDKQETLDKYLLNQDTTIAIGHPDTVPAGKYAKQVLESLNLYKTLEDQLILAKDVRQVLTYIETGNADYGFVYKSDALSSKSSEILMTIDEALYDPIVYPAAVLTNAEQKEAAIQFLTFLKSDKANKIFESFGFSKQ